MKSGSNDYHGSLFEFFRNEKLNARNLFATTGPKPLFRRNQYGFVFGGPIQKQKTFFFADYQGSKQLVGVVRTSTVPTSQQRRGVFSTPIFDPATTQVGGGGLSRDAFADNTIPAEPIRSGGFKSDSTGFRCQTFSPPMAPKPQPITTAGRTRNDSTKTSSMVALTTSLRRRSESSGATLICGTIRAR